MLFDIVFPCSRFLQFLAGFQGFVLFFMGNFFSFCFSGPAMFVWAASFSRDRVLILSA
jgi:hypothetical protein